VGKITKAEGIDLLKKAKAKMARATTKDETLAILKEAGSAVGYAPAYRCLVAGTEPENSIKWED